MKRREGGENCIMWSFVICTLRIVLVCLTENFSAILIWCVISFQEECILAYLRYIPPDRRLTVEWDAGTTKRGPFWCSTKHFLEEPRKTTKNVGLHNRNESHYLQVRSRTAHIRLLEFASRTLSWSDIEEWRRIEAFIFESQIRELPSTNTFLQNGNNQNELAARTKSNLTTNNKLLIYEAVLKPICTYGTQLWG
jgi:hypothetical protein